MTSLAPLEARVPGWRGSWARGFQCPRGFALEIGPFRELTQSRLPEGHDPHSLLRLRKTSVFVERAARARALVLGEALPPLLEDELAALWELVQVDAPWGLAVRSSAAGEDDGLISMAGLTTTELGVRGPVDLGRALQRVWASVFLPQGLAYLAARGARDVSMAVIFQVVVPAQAAGVALSMPARGGDASPGGSDLLVNATYGLGVLVPFGMAAPDVVRVERTTGQVIEYDVGEKRRAFYIASGGLEERDVATDDIHGRSLSESHARAPVRVRDPARTGGT